MAYTRKNIKNLTGGVSQQPDSERFDNQCTAQTNFLADPIKGLTKRAGTNYVQIIEGGGLEALQHPSKNTFTHVINRSSGEQLMLVIGYDGDGADTTPDIMLLKLNEETDTLEQQVLQNSAGATLSASDINYLDVSNNYDTHPWSAVTIADYTFIANKDQTPALKATTSGGAGMYEREHVKRGMIFIKEGAYSSEFTVKATDSEGTTRSMRLETNTAKFDINTNQITGAIHYMLEEEEETVHARQFWHSVGTGDTYTQLGSVPLSLVMYWSDDSEHHVFNGDGLGADITAQRLRSGSNYEHGYLTFVTQPDVNDKITMTAATSLATTTSYEFGVTTSGSNIGVAIGSTMLETMENLVAAINLRSETVTMKLKANLVYDETESSYLVNVHATVDTGVDPNAVNAALVLDVGNAARFTVSDMTGGHGTSTGEYAAAPVRNRIHFQRETIYDSAATPQLNTTGSIISWYASFSSKEDADASPIKIEVFDAYGDTMTETFTGKTDRISVLPAHAPNNYLMKVEGDIENDADDHYIKFTNDSDVATSNQFGGGKWKEDVQSGIQYQVDEATMPHQLIKVSSTIYKFVPATWSDKTVGDENSDAAPSFIGNPINDVFYYKSRLGILAGESVILSEVDNASNFWRTSVIDSVDSDRIDITSSVNEITYLNWAIPFANQLIIFSDRAQFLVTQGAQGLTPSTAALSLGSSYENSTIARPVVNDSTIIFAQEKSGASALFEMYPTGNTELGFEATNISEHIPSYISGKIVNIRASSLASTVVVQTDSGDNTLYIYKYYNSGGKRVQSAWSKYELASDYIKGGHFLSDKFHLIEGHHISLGTTVSSCYWILTYMKFDNTDSLTNSVDLHFNAPSGSVTDSGADTHIAMDNAFDIRDNTARKGKIVAFNKVDNTSYTVADSGASGVVVLTGVNLAGNANIVVGLKFDATYEFSKQYLKRGSADGKEVAVTDGRTTTKWVEVYFNDTQHLTTTVSFPTVNDATGLKYREDSVKTYTGTFAGGGVTGDQPSETSTLRTSVAARNDLPTITLSSGTHQTVTITGAAFELMHTSRASRTS